MKQIKVNKCEPVTENGKGCPYCFPEKYGNFCEHYIIISNIDKEIDNFEEREKHRFYINDKRTGYSKKQLITTKNGDFPDWCPLEDLKNNKSKKQDGYDSGTTLFLNEWEIPNEERQISNYNYNDFIKKDIHMPPKETITKKIKIKSISKAEPEIFDDEED